MKKYLLLIVSVILSVMVMAQDAEITEVASGSCGKDGDNLKWTLNSEGLMTVSGKGEMMDHPTWGGHKYDVYKLVLEEGVTSVGESAFFWCEDLFEVVFPSTIEFIGVGAFLGTDWYTKLPVGEVYVGTILMAYKGEMFGETSVTVKEGTKRIMESAFSECENLVEIHLPKSLISIERIAFLNCKDLRKIQVDALVPPVIDGSTFAGVPRNIEFVVPKESEEAYRSDLYWSTFMSQTALENTDMSEVEIYREGDQLVVFGAEEGFEIYNVSGALVYRGSDNRVKLNKGIYIIKGSNWSDKISF